MTWNISRVYLHVSSMQTLSATSALSALTAEALRSGRSAHLCAGMRGVPCMSRWPSSRCTTRANFLNDGVDVARAEPSMAVASAAMAVAVAELWLLLRLRLLLSYARAW